MAKAPGRESATARAEFRDLRFHAAGGLGEVFMARNAELNREVALKFIKPERTPRRRQPPPVPAEAEVTGRLEHPGVVPVYGLGTDADGAPYYAMRFVRGETLQDAIEPSTPPRARPRPGRAVLALRELLDRFVSICNTMAYAHSRGIIHRDLKPRQRHARQVRRDAGGGLGPGQGVRPRRGGAVGGRGDADAQLGLGERLRHTDGGRGRHAGVHEPRAGRRRGWTWSARPATSTAWAAILYAILTGQAPSRVAHRARCWRRSSGASSRRGRSSRVAPRPWKRSA